MPVPIDLIITTCEKITKQQLMPLFGQPGHKFGSVFNSSKSFLFSKTTLPIVKQNRLNFRLLEEFVGETRSRSLFITSQHIFAIEESSSIAVMVQTHIATVIVVFHWSGK